MPNELIEELLELSKVMMEAIKQFSENYDKVTTYLTQPQTAALEEAIKKLNWNYETMTKLTQRQVEMVNKMLCYCPNPPHCTPLFQLTETPR